MRHLIVLAGIALAASTAFAQTNISTCNPSVAAPAGSLITASGDYQVTANLSQPTAGRDCIDIQASDVILKLNGYQIVGSSGANNGIDVGGPGRLSQVVIQGPGLVTGFSEGVNISACDYCTVTQTTTAGNVNGVFSSTATYLTLTSNIAAQNTDGGIFMELSTNGNVQYNELIGNQGLGLYLVDSIANTIANNNASGNGRAGIFLSSSSGTRVTGNRTDGNSSNGIYVFGSSGNQIFSNLASAGNGGEDLADGTAGCGSDTWSNNAFFTVNQSCVH